MGTCSLLVLPVIAYLSPANSLAMYLFTADCRCYVGVNGVTTMVIIKAANTLQPAVIAQLRNVPTTSSCAAVIGTDAVRFGSAKNLQYVSILSVQNTTPSVSAAMAARGTSARVSVVGNNSSLLCRRYIYRVGVCSPRFAINASPKFSPSRRHRSTPAVLRCRIYGAANGAFWRLQQLKR